MAKLFETAQDAEDAFYDAFEENNLDKMMSAWASENDIACIQPMREQVRGRAAVRSSWEEVFSFGAEMEIEIHHQQWIEMIDVAIHIVHEQLTFKANPTQKPPPLIATNVYRQAGQGWHMVLHHTSPPPPPPQEAGPGMGVPPRF
ncbi:MAG: nuclear transport factor 2 family protein [Gammaproteobacteria bacterium]|nr:nuclear transport factor 2 family protein [Gammaproteobacteria bacterium]